MKSERLRLRFNSASRAAQTDRLDTPARSMAQIHNLLDASMHCMRMHATPHEGDAHKQAQNPSHWAVSSAQPNLYVKHPPEQKSHRSIVDRALIVVDM